MSRWVNEDTPNRIFARRAREARGDFEQPSEKWKQTSLFPKKDVPRLQPHQASPRQFAHLPGIQWHGNYDEAEVTRPNEDVDLWGGYRYNSVGVHAGTQRAAKDIIDWHGPFDYAEHIGGDEDPPEYDQRMLADEQAAVNARGGRHGYLHPVLPHHGDIVPGLRKDQGDEWGNVVGGVNGALRREVNSADWNGDYATVAPHDIRKGLRYKNESEHPGHTSTLIPTGVAMQHSDYVLQALMTASGGIHPETLALFQRGILDKAEARKYNPTTSAARPHIGPGTSDRFRRDRTDRARRTVRSRQFDQTLPFEES